MLADFQQQINDLALQDHVAEIFNDKFENFESTRKFDLITAIHSWHYIGYEIQQLKNALSLLAPGGVFCIAQTSEHAFSKPLKELLHPKGHFFIDIEPLSKFCTEHSLQHELIPISKIVPLERYIKNDEFTEYGKSWLSMMGRVEYENIPPQVVEQAKQIIKSFSKHDTIDDAWGVIIFSG